MLVVCITLVALGLIGALLFLRKPTPAAAAVQRSGSTGAAQAGGQARTGGSAAVATPRPRSAEELARLAALVWIRAEKLPAPRRQAITAVFKHVPRPPRLMQQLISPEFVNNTGLEELAELIGREPLVAARVLAKANSAMFGLATPVTGLPQAISTLGLITLRILCLQYMMIRSFKADSPERQALLTNVWNASTLASELTLKLARATGRPEPGRLVTLVVLSFLGRLATTSTMPRSLLGSIAVGSFLDRTLQEQASLGLSASEIGGLLMRDWDLPAALIDEVRRVDPTLTEADPELDLGLCYLCARLGEQLASGELKDLADFDLALDDSLDLHCLQRRLPEPAWQGLAAALREPALCEAMRVMTRAVRSGTTAFEAVPA